MLEASRGAARLEQGRKKLLPLPLMPGTAPRKKSGCSRGAPMLEQCMKLLAADPAKKSDNWRILVGVEW
jgi:hypothetical protein